MASLNGFSDAEGYVKDPECAGVLGRKCYQHCRNIYLLLVESFFIAKKQEDFVAARQFISEALAICKRGSLFIDHYRNALSSSEHLEMARCKCEALFLSGSDEDPRPYEDSRRQCRNVYTEYSKARDPGLLRILLRILAVWIAALQKVPNDGDNTEAVE
jgi:hypothetical protein